MNGPAFGAVFRRGKWLIIGFQGPLVTARVQILAYISRLPQGSPLGCTNDAHIQLY
jgi:hypothetical protein